MADSDFQIETFESETFVSSSTDQNGSRDKAYAFKQSAATDKSNWSNDSQKYLAQRNYVESIRNAFTLIRDALESFKNNGGSTEAAERFNIQYYIERQLGFIGSCTEQFWDEFSHFKDRLSYKFGSRHFPTNDGRWAESFNDDNKTTAAITSEPGVVKSAEQRRKEIAELQRATMERISKQYDINDVHLRNFMDRNYVDGDSSGSYSPLETNQYYDLIGLTDMEYLFKMAYEAKLYGVMLLLWCNFVAAKQFVHLILGSEYIVNLMFNPTIYSYEILKDNKLKTVTQNPFMDEKYREVINHYMFYGIYVLCREEYYVKTKATEDMRYLLDIRVVSKLMVHDGPLMSNPYMPVTLSEKYLYGTETPVENRVIRPIRAPAKARGLYGLESFKSRFTVFTDGTLEGLAFDKMYFTGSLIAACCIRNPLEKRFGIEYNGDENKASVYWIANQRALVDYFNEYYPGKGVLNLTGLTNVQIAELEENLTDIDCIIDALEDSEFDRLCIRTYECIKANLLKKHNKRTIGREDLNITKIETNQSYKYYIDGKLLNRSFELFRIYDLRPAGCVSRFHFAPVRGYYNGTTVYVLPSMLCAAQTGICTDYKWFSDSKKPQTLICKYYTRGFHILLNSEEQAEMRKFMADNPAWSMLDELPKPVGSDDDGEDDPGKNRDVTISIMNPIFNPRVSRVGTFNKLDHLVIAPTLKYVQDADVSNLIKPKQSESHFGLDMSFRYGAGHVKPVNLWYATPYARDLARSKKYAAIV
jgi:hypothetical protein